MNGVNFSSVHRPPSKQGTNDLKHSQQLSISRLIAKYLDDPKKSPAEKAKYVVNTVRSLDKSETSIVIVAQALNSVANLYKDSTNIKIDQTEINQIIDHWLYHTKHVKPDPRELSNVTRAAAILKVSHVRFINILVDQTKNATEKFDIQSVGNSSWAFATLGIKDKDLFEAIARRAQQLITGFVGQDIASTAWAFATVGIKDRQLFDALARQTEKLISTFDAQSVTNTAWSFATLKIRDVILLESLAQRVLAVVNSYTPLSIANATWAFARLGIENKKLFTALAAQASSCKDGFSLQNIAMMAWGLCHSHVDLAKSFLMSLRYDINSSQHSRNSVQQLHIAEVITGIRPANSPCAFIKQEWNADSGTCTSAFEQEVSEILILVNQQKGNLLTIEHGKLVEGIPTDFIVTNPNTKVRHIIECDGDRFHQYSDGTPLGRDKIQDRLFAAVGYIPRHISDSEWRILSLEQQQQLVVKLLDLQA